MPAVQPPYAAKKHPKIRRCEKCGLIPRELGKHFDLLFNNRQKGDYSDFARFKAEDVTGWLEETQKFLAHAESLIPKLTQ